MVTLVALKRSSLIILNLIAAIVYLSIGWASGSIAHVDTSIFSSNDSQNYRDVAHWIYGTGANTESSALRPFLYPLLLGAAERLAGTRGVWLLNVALWFATLNITAAATYQFVKSNSAAALVFLVLATNVSLILLSFQGLTEITTVFLLAVWIYGLSHLTRRPTPAQVAWALLPVTLLTVVKPQFEILLAFTAVILIIGVVKSPARGLAATVFVACLIPVAIQVALMVHFNGYFGISSIGDKTFRLYFLSRLDVTIRQTSDIQVARQQMAGLNNLDAGRFVLNHFGDAVVVFVSTLKDNLLAGTSFLVHNTPYIARGVLRRVVLVTQLTYFVLLVTMIPLVVVTFWRARDHRLALLCIATLNVFLAGGLTFGQGDRITIIALPLWLSALVLALSESGRAAGWGSLGARIGSTSTPITTGKGSSEPTPGTPNAMPGQKTLSTVALTVG